MRGAGVRALLAVIAIGVAVTAAPAHAARDTLVIGMPTDLPIFDTHKATGTYRPRGRPARATRASSGATCSRTASPR